MYSTLLVIHSLFRWLVLSSLLLSIYKAYTGLASNRPFTKGDDSLRHWTATIAHIQLTIGILLYIKSPVIQYFWSNFREAIADKTYAFFGLVHISLMLLSVILITIGSALAKRKKTDKEKFKTMLQWFTITLIILFIAIPWPFSPLANRPYFRL